MKLAGKNIYIRRLELADATCLIGRANLSNVVHGAWQNCTIGYFFQIF